MPKQHGCLHCTCCYGVECLNSDVQRRRSCMAQCRFRAGKARQTSEQLARTAESQCCQPVTPPSASPLLRLASGVARRLLLRPPAGCFEEALCRTAPARAPCPGAAGVHRPAAAAGVPGTADMQAPSVGLCSVFRDSPLHAQLAPSAACRAMTAQPHARLWQSATCSRRRHPWRPGCHPQCRPPAGRCRLAGCRCLRVAGHGGCGRGSLAARSRQGPPPGLGPVQGWPATTYPAA